ncbi:MAG TPA: hypothetical protein VMM59_03460 [Thermohalobaculum sp.]|nr:hypothetical protein [Thermohalobaculum sp.]
MQGPGNRVCRRHGRRRVPGNVQGIVNGGIVNGIAAGTVLGIRSRPGRQQPGRQQNERHGQANSQRHHGITLLLGLYTSMLDDSPSNTHRAIQSFPEHFPAHFLSRRVINAATAQAGGN